MDRRAAAAEVLAAAEARARGRMESGPTEATGRAKATGLPDDAEPATGLPVRGGTDTGVGRRRRRERPPPPDPAADREPEPEDVARAIVLRQLSMGPRSRKQLEDKLRQRACPEQVAAKVLDRMTEVGLVDDQAYADLLVRSRQAGRGLAKRALAHELRGRGVADETIEQAIGSIDRESEQARAEQIAARRMRALAGLAPQVQARRLAGVLARKGYPPALVYAVVRDAVNEAPEHRRD